MSMYPARWEDAAQRDYRVRCWRYRLPPNGAPFPGDPREVEQRTGTTATLTPLGKKLLGLEEWA